MSIKKKNSIIFPVIIFTFLFLGWNIAGAAKKATITSVDYNKSTLVLTVTWNQLEPIEQCYVEVTAGDLNYFFSPTPIPDEPGYVPCGTAGSKTGKSDLSPDVFRGAPLYTTIADNLNSEIVSDYVLFKTESDAIVSPAPSPSPTPTPAPAPSPSPVPPPFPSPIITPIPSVSANKEISPQKRIPLKIVQNLGKGSSGEEVKALQSLLIAENVYPEKLVTGFFGDLTKTAVIRFQEKYKNEILVPLGLVSGTGYAGPATLKKINSLLETSGLLLPDSGSSSSNVFSRDLYDGLSGDDVERLQLFLQDQDFFPPGLLAFAMEEPYRTFGLSTRAAVIKFQEKYRDEILVPAGLVSGSGYVGPLTRAKIEALLQSRKNN